MIIRVEFYVGQTTGDTQGTWFLHQQEIEIDTARDLEDIHNDELLQKFNLPGEYAFIGVYYKELVPEIDEDGEEDRIFLA